VGWKEHPHQRLTAYRLARRLAIDLYRETANFPVAERYGLVSQIRRAGVSIPANIAEGAARQSKRDFARFLLFARGSVNELRVLLEIATEIGCLTEECFRRLEAVLNELFAVTTGLIRHCDSKAKTS
jgi:four helix bundle protein